MRTIRSFFPTFLFLLTAMVPWPVQAQGFNIDILHAFTGPPDGSGPGPNATIIRDAQGNLYGTTAGGGDRKCQNGGGAGCGTVYKVDNQGNYTILYSFVGGSTDGAFPISGVVQNSAGNLFGTTRGGNGVSSTLYEVNQSGEETTLFRFDNFADGDYANSAPTLDSDGNLFGTTLYGGDSSCGFNGNGCGVVYEMKKNGTFSLLYTFTSLAEGIEPSGSPPVVDSNGDLFGVAQLGGDLSCDPPDGCGAVFEVDHTGKYRVLHKFTGKADGSFPACVIDDGAGGLFGVTESGGGSCGFYGCGTIFRMDKTGGLTTLYAFTPFTENNDGHSCLVRDSIGNLYGTNFSGGSHNAGYLGVLSTSRNYTVLYNFPTFDSPQGGAPLGVVLGPSGTFFGVNALGGDLGCGVENSGCGTVFELNPVWRR
jgi:uncharacterized repeat protein (TIGR03803 family)